MDSVDLKPGRELDKLIATQVMGLQLVSGRSPFSDEPAAFGPTHAYRLPNFSTDDEAAWEIRSHLQKKGLWVVTGKTLHPTGPIEWNATVNRMGSNGEITETYQANGDSAPHAICLAALMAVGTNHG